MRRPVGRRSMEKMSSAVTPFQPTHEELAERRQVLAAIIAKVEANERIMLPDFDRDRTGKTLEEAFALMGIEPNPYGSTIGEFRYQFEGEDDLLHLMIVRQDAGEITPHEALAVAHFLLPDLPPALVFFKPGERSQHFYIGHDHLLEFGVA